MNALHRLAIGILLSLTTLGLKAGDAMKVWASTQDRRLTLSPIPRN